MARESSFRPRPTGDRTPTGSQLGKLDAESKELTSTVVDMEMGKDADSTVQAQDKGNEARQRTGDRVSAAKGAEEAEMQASLDDAWTAGAAGELHNGSASCPPPSLLAEAHRTALDGRDEQQHDGQRKSAALGTCRKESMDCDNRREMSTPAPSPPRPPSSSSMRNRSLQQQQHQGQRQSPVLAQRQAHLQDHALPNSAQVDLTPCHSRRLRASTETLYSQQPQDKIDRGDPIQTRVLGPTATSAGRIEQHHGQPSSPHPLVHLRPLSPYQGFGRINAHLDAANTRQVGNGGGSKSGDLSEFGISSSSSSKQASAHTISSAPSIMQRFRRMQEKGKARAGLSDLDSFGELKPFPSSNSSSSLFSLGISKKDKGKAKASDDASSLYSLPRNGSSTSLKLPRPRSWVNSLMSVGSGSSTNKLAKPASPGGRPHSIDIPHGTPPVSSLVFQDEFDHPSWPLDGRHRMAEWDQPQAEDNAANLGRSATRTTVGTLRTATMSTPNLPASTSEEWAERLRAPLLVRNLDEEPRGTATPQIGRESAAAKAETTRKMTNPWVKLMGGSTTEEATMQHPADRLIAADEEEQILSDAVQRDRTEGRMANEEQAVLDMLDQMNAAVDTFDHPNMTRTKSMATDIATATDRPSLKRAKTQAPDRFAGREAKKRPHSALPVVSPIQTDSPGQPSVRAFATMFESGSDAPDVLLSRAKMQSGRRKPASAENSSLGSVKKAVQEREHLDKTAKVSAAAPSIEPLSTNTAGSLLQAMSSTLRSKTSLASFRSGATPFSESADEGTDLSEGKTDTPRGASPTSAQPGALLHRRPTRAVSKHSARSPNQESYISSEGHGTSSSLWSRIEPGHESSESLVTSPGVLSESEAGNPFGYGFGKRRMGDGRPFPPLLRRLRTDATQATTISSILPSPTKENEVGTALMEEPLQSDASSSISTGSANEKEGSTVLIARDFGEASSSSLKRPRSQAFSTLSRSSTRFTHKSASSIPPTPPRKDVPLSGDNTASDLNTLRPLRLSPTRNQANTSETGVSPALLGTPKRAKDLINFFEQSSAPNSPSLARTARPAAKQLSPRKGESPAQAANRFRRALGASSLSNQSISVDIGEAGEDGMMHADADDSAIREKIATVGRGHRRRARGAAPIGLTTGGGNQSDDPFTSSYDNEYDVGSEDRDSDGGDENAVPNASIGRGMAPRGGNRIRNGSATFFGKMLGTSPNNKRATNDEPSDAPGRTDAPSRSGGKTSSSPEKSTDAPSARKSSGISPFRSGVKNIINALSNGVNITGDVPSSGGGRRSSLPGSHQAAPPPAYRDPTIPKMNRKRSSELSDLQSVISTRTIGTIASFRQKTERGNLRIDTESTLALMGEENAEPFRTGLVYYFNVHTEQPVWQRAQAVLLPSAVALSWIPIGGGRVSVVLDLSACREVHSVPGPGHPSSVDDLGAKVARDQGLNLINPFQLIFDDGVERMAVETARDRALWVSAVWDALGVRRSSRAPRSRQVSSNHPFGDAATDIADLHMTTPRPPSPTQSPAPPNFNIQLSDSPARRLMPSGLAAVPLEVSQENLAQIDASSPSKDRYEGIAVVAEDGPPPPPPKEKRRRKRFVDDGKLEKKVDAVQTQRATVEVADDQQTDEDDALGQDKSKHSQETLVTGEDSAQQDQPTNQSRETFHSAAQEEVDDFGPLSPRSEAVLNFSSARGEGSEIDPADSASQRPSRSLTGTIFSRFTALAGYRADKADTAVATAQTGMLDNDATTESPRTPAQTIRDRFMGDDEAGEPPSARMLDTVVEETQSQAAATSANHAVPVGSSKAVAAAKRAASMLSFQTSGSVSSQELAKLLQFIEQQNEDRERRDRQMEAQFRTFQDTLISMQRSERRSRRSSSEASRSASTRTSTTGTERGRASSSRNAATAVSVAADAAALAAMQEKLDRVLSLVGNVYEDQGRLEGAADATPRGPQPPSFRSPADLARIERTLGTLMDQMQNTLPDALRADNRLMDADGRPLDGRDRAILADRMVHGTHASRRRMSAPPSVEPEDMDVDGFLTPMTGQRAGLPPSDMADVYSPAMAPSHSLSSMASQDRIPPRSWVSAQGVPSPPANTERGGSLVSQRQGPVERAAMGMTPTPRNRSQQPTYDALAPGDSLSNVSIDMEAEIRRRRMRNTAGLRGSSEDQDLNSGGWLTPRAGAQQQRGGGAGLGLTMPYDVGHGSNTPRAHGDARISQSIQTPALEGRDGMNPDVALLLDAIKENEQARQAQRQQQQDIARYLNELNSWLERDVIDRSKEWRTLAMGVTQLHDELNSLKNGGMAAAPGGLMPMPMPAAAQQPAHPDGAAPRITFMGDAPLTPQQQRGAAAAAAEQPHPIAADADVEMVGPSGPRGMPGQAMTTADFALSPGYAGGAMPLTSAALEQLGADAPAPLNVPRPGSPVRRSGTRTWRAQAAPAGLRNDDVWQSSGSVARKDKESKKADKRARRRKSFSKIAALAGGAALVAAATHEYDKHKERQRNEGKPEEASKEADVATGRHVKHESVPSPHADRITQAALKGDEVEVRNAVRGAAEAGAGAPAISHLVEQLRKSNMSDSAADAGDESTLTGSRDSAMHDADGNAFSVDSDTLRNAFGNVGSQSAGGDGALALAVEEILKHLLEKKEEERQRQRDLTDAEAAREAARKQEEMDREERMSTLRDRERGELVETLLAKLQAEKERQEAEQAARQREMDPKSAIESLVAAINTQRQADVSQRANADAAVKQMAEDLVRTTSEQNTKLVEAVHAAAREMLRHNVEAHAEDLKRQLSREVNLMFEDVGKIREAKRALELEISDLFSIKSRHLVGLDNLKAVSAATAMSAPMPAPMMAPPMPTSMSMPGMVPMGMGMGMGMGGAPMFNMASAPPMPDIPAAPMSQPKASAIPPAIPPAPSGGGGPNGPRKKDFMSPFSINFGAR